MEGREDRRRGRVAGGFPRQAGAARLFFALWPDDAVRAALAGLAGTLRGECGGRQVPEQNIHLTLVFLGAISTELVPAMERMAAETPGAPVQLVLETVDYWRHNRIVWAGTERCPAALRELSGRLGEGARRLGIAIEAREYVPHITLLREATRAPVQRQFGRIPWHASEFALVRSRGRPDGAGYEVIARWALAPGGDGRSQPAA